MKKTSIALLTVISMTSIAQADTYKLFGKKDVAPTNFIISQDVTKLPYDRALEALSATQSTERPGSTSTAGTRVYGFKFNQGANVGQVYAIDNAELWDLATRSKHGQIVVIDKPYVFLYTPLTARMFKAVSTTQAAN